jgi:small subunit ribosomal protein S1
VNHPSEVVKVGQEIEVQVLDVDLNRERISLGLKQTTEDPWRVLVKKYPVGAIVEGVVTKLVSFGAFVDLGEGVEGLVHISEMARQHVDQPSQVCNVGDKVQVKVMEIDLDRRRISLSMKSAAETLGFDVPVKPLDKSEEGEGVAEEEAPKQADMKQEADEK